MIVKKKYKPMRSIFYFSLYCLGLFGVISCVLGGWTVAIFSIIENNGGDAGLAIVMGCVVLIPPYIICEFLLMFTSQKNDKPDENWPNINT
ncbi:hypothetical protein [Colwellia sp. TT2012]|uniref:hypothetical protein n=1 Tax=Colwellia sp. TT2012 TaxID=1720342 RepID=UPI00070DFBA0|nr:hypothetical protein [Colwellia sp. TT2012]